jgi:hypothetical protein
VEKADEKSSGDESEVRKPRKRRKKDSDLKTTRQRRRGRNQVDVDSSFFTGLRPHSTELPLCNLLMISTPRVE